jgi:pimeloyl-ACP methyl ester carboxylesterase
MDAFSMLSAPAAASSSWTASSSNHPPATTKSKTKRIYRTIEDAIRTRQQTAIKSPGDQWISYEATKEMVEWALEPATATTIMNGEDDGGWTFRHDPRLHWPALQAHTLEQAFDFWKSLQTGKVPTLWLRAEHGWPYSTKWLDRAEAYLGENLITIRTLEGSHHFHADPETVDAVAATILEHFIVPSPSNT